MVVMPGTAADVSTPSGERSAMDRDLEMIDHIREGAEAIRRHSARYLPKYENESSEEYSRRVKVAPWRPEFADTLRFLASKPFGADVIVADDTPERLAILADDIDGSGNNLTRFARHAFTEAIANGVHGILVDWSVKGDAHRMSVAEERAIGARPRWIHIPVASIVALRTSVVNGREVVTHLRYRFSVVEPDGFGEKKLDQIRLVEPDHWELWQRNDSTGTWSIVEEGPIVVGGKTIDEVPLALLFTGERLGQLQTRPPLRDLAEVQIELFRALSRQDEILTYTGSPMLAAVGMARPTDGAAIEIGPKTILFAPAVGEGTTAKWEFISPDPDALGEIRQHIASIVEDMHRLGLQPTHDAVRIADGHHGLNHGVEGAQRSGGMGARVEGLSGARVSVHGTVAGDRPRYHGPGVHRLRCWWSEHRRVRADPAGRGGFGDQQAHGPRGVAPPECPRAAV